MAPRILLLGGHGRVSLYMTPAFLSRSWHVTSVIRNPSHAADIESAGAGQPGKLDVLVSSLDNVTSEQHAQSILDKTKPDWVVWSAGAGGKGGPARTAAIDRDAAIHFITASARTPSVTKFLMVSYCSSRRGRAPWWDDADWEAAQEVNFKTLPHYAAAKMDADECLVALARQRREQKGAAPFQDIDLRPGTLTDEPATGRVSLGRTRARGKVSRADVAEVAALLLEKEGARGWFDLLGGEEEVREAVERCVKEGIDDIEGEDLEGIVAKYKL